MYTFLKAGLSLGSWSWFLICPSQIDFKCRNSDKWGLGDCWTWETESVFSPCWVAPGKYWQSKRLRGLGVSSAWQSHLMWEKGVEEPPQPSPPHSSSLEQPYLAPREGQRLLGLGFLGVFFLGVGQRDKGTPPAAVGAVGSSAGRVWGAAPTTPLPALGPDSQNTLQVLGCPLEWPWSHPGSWLNKVREWELDCSRVLSPVECRP